MRCLVPFILVITLIAICVADAEEKAASAVPLPALDGASSEGLEIECHLAKTEFVIGEPVNIWCTVANTTDGIKPVGWHALSGNHFCCVQGDKEKWEGVSPLAIPQLRRPVLVKSREGQPGYVLFIPPRESIQILLTYKPAQPCEFKGRVVYDPLSPRGGWVAEGNGGPPWKDQWIYSNEFEYRVVAAERE